MTTGIIEEGREERESLLYDGLFWIFWFFDLGGGREFARAHMASM